MSRFWRRKTRHKQILTNKSTSIEILKGFGKLGEKHHSTREVFRGFLKFRISNSRNLLQNMAGTTRLELATSAVTA
jgi:hypothetical protein